MLPDCRIHLNSVLSLDIDINLFSYSVPFGSEVVSESLTCSSSTATLLGKQTSMFKFFDKLRLKRKRKSSLPKEKIEMYQSRLLKEQTRLLKEIGKQEKPVDFGNEIDSFDEETDEAEEFSNRLAITQPLRERLNEIGAALGRIREGTYGMCEQCGQEFSEKMLEIVPESRLCRDCKKPG